MLYLTMHQEVYSINTFKAGMRIRRLTIRHKRSLEPNPRSDSFQMNFLCLIAFDVMS